MKKRQQKQIQIQSLEINLDLDTMIGIVHMHICGTPKPLPRGYQIFKATVKGCDLTLYLKPFFVPTTPTAQQVFHLPSEVPGQIRDWNIDTFNEPMQILQQLADTFIINKLDILQI